ncbi:uncharacterized protein LOC128856680 [Anastrepha ludens]|uniref:uncharacterized protein LOC128856680 n=1 Tax=Anastrepha ludens TaxID=28586 RepID=UPI0023B17BA9|nr:uncharacterized protein LOC128856680 [Anastrepha ludens]
MERVVYDGANTCLTCGGHYVPSTATSEINLTSELAVHVDTLPHLEQYAVRRCIRNTYTSKSSRFKSTIQISLSAAFQHLYEQVHPHSSYFLSDSLLRHVLLIYVNLQTITITKSGLYYQYLKFFDVLV